MVKLFCAVVGAAGSVFSVRVAEDDSVDGLKKAIKAENSATITCDAKDLQLFLAKKGGAWLNGASAAAVTLDEAAGSAVSVLVDDHGNRHDFVKMDPLLWINNSKHFGANFQPGEGQVHVLVVVPKPAHSQEELSLVSGSIQNALNTKGIRCRVYRLAASYLGYYDPDLRAGECDKALWYDGATLRIHALFESKENALLFDNVLQDECITLTSPLDGHAVSTNVAPISRELSELRRIYSRHYVPEDTDSPQVTMSSLSTNTSIVDVVTDEFKYQRTRVKSCSGLWGRRRAVI